MSSFGTPIFTTWSYAGALVTPLRPPVSQASHAFMNCAANPVPPVALPDILQPAGDGAALAVSGAGVGDAAGAGLSATVVLADAAALGVACWQPASRARPASSAAAVAVRRIGHPSRSEILVPRSTINLGTPG